MLYTITPMLEDFQCSASYEVASNGVYSLVDQYNHQLLPHPDCWFTIHDSEGREMSMGDFIN